MAQCLTAATACRGSGFGSQHPHSGSQLSVDSSEDLLHSSGLCRHGNACSTHIYNQTNTHVQRCGEGNPHSLSVGVETGAGTVEISVGVSHKTKN